MGIEQTTSMSTEQTVFTWTGLVSGIKGSVPIAAGVFTYGIVFGVLARQTTLGLGETLLMSATVFAASAQFVVLEMWGRQPSVAAIIITTFLVNIKHLLMGASVRPWVQRLSPKTIYSMLFFINDESWGLAMRARNAGETDAAFLFGSGLLVFVTWVSATLLGLTVGRFIHNPATYGLDFVFIAIYITLLVGVWDGREDALPIGVAAATAVAAAVLLPGNWYIIIGGVIGSMAGVVRDAYA